jgi:hypothetical protein
MVTFPLKYCQLGTFKFTLFLIQQNKTNNPMLSKFIKKTIPKTLAFQRTKRIVHTQSELTPIELNDKKPDDEKMFKRSCLIAGGSFVASIALGDVISSLGVLSSLSVRGVAWTSGGVLFGTSYLMFKDYSEQTQKFLSYLGFVSRSILLSTYTPYLSTMELAEITMFCLAALGANIYADKYMPKITAGTISFISSFAVIGAFLFMPDNMYINAQFISLLSLGMIQYISAFKSDKIMAKLKTVSHLRYSYDNIMSLLLLFCIIAYTIKHKNKNKLTEIN